jgi:hypothetical protein
MPESCGSRLGKQTYTWPVRYQVTYCRHAAMPSAGRGRGGKSCALISASLAVFGSKPGVGLSIPPGFPQGLCVVTARVLGVALAARRAVAAESGDAAPNATVAEMTAMMTDERRFTFATINPSQLERRESRT